jgi:hypothetical protein
MSSELKKEIEKALMLAFGIGIILGLLLFLFNGCGPAHSDEGVRAVEIPGPVNVVCYAIQDNGKTVGGNCLWAR